MDENQKAELRTIYQDLHTHPELSHQETRTAGIVSAWLRAEGFEVVEPVGSTGVVGVLRNGDGPTVLLRADMDALPVTEETGLPYASQTAGVMHACGHDVHVTCLLGATRELAGAKDSWQGTLVALFQPAEETINGAEGMVDDGLYDRVPKPDVVLGQHVAPMPAGLLGLQTGPAFAASDSIRVTMFGEGSHGSRPEGGVDPIVMAAATVLRLQTVVSREIAGSQTAVLTVGAINAGTKANIIPDTAELLLNVRSYEPELRDRVLAAIDRIVNAEAQASNAPKPPIIDLFEHAPVLVNDVDASARTRSALEAVGMVVEPGPVTGSEDVGVLSEAAGAPLVYWLLGGADPALFAGASTVEEFKARVESLPANHSPKYAPVPEPTLEMGVRALVAAATEWLG